MCVHRVPLDVYGGLGAGSLSLALQNINMNININKGGVFFSRKAENTMLCV